MRPTELNQLKAMTTALYIDERLPYGRNKVRLPHVASFCATGNNPLFLSDDDLFEIDQEEFREGQQVVFAKPLAVGLRREVTPEAGAMVHTTDNSPEKFASYFRRWLVGMLAGALDERTVNHVIFVLIGRQGSYKTSFMQNLLPPCLRRYFTGGSRKRIFQGSCLWYAPSRRVCRSGRSYRPRAGGY